ncbi:hypothetical protein ACIA8O_24930 [Kitasatospora sp. NPDC051853]|uniref:hypothetical protein n=1 Tax=Kitasatospora sp. NPDC051853 TaxID=3364058 RepID=UPI00379D2197
MKGKGEEQPEPDDGADGTDGIQYPHLGLVLVVTVSLGSWSAGYRTFLWWFLALHAAIAALTITRGIRRRRGLRTTAARTYYFTFGIWYRLLELM